jgi:hypothetical protein
MSPPHVTTAQAIYSCSLGGVVHHLAVPLHMLGRGGTTVSTPSPGPARLILDPSLSPLGQ